jgi:molecular chaperone HscB
LQVVPVTGSVSDFFSVLQLPAGCEVDLALLERNYRELLGRWHPDRVAGADAAQKLAALQMASLVNDAYATLKSPLARAAHLLQLRGCDVATHRQADLEPAFLLQQMQLRDELEELVAGKDESGLSGFLARVDAGRAALWREFAANIDQPDLGQARRVFHKLQFMAKLQEEARAAEDRLLGY